MCGRYHFGIKTDTKIGKQIEEITQKLNLVYATGEIFPSSDVLCVIPKESKITLDVKKWGIQAKSLLINARVETIDDRPTYNSIKHNRCAIICDSFYEWDKNKNKYQISFDSDYVYLACISNESNELVILTTAADKDFETVHDRMPIIMNESEMLNYIHNRNDIFAKKKLSITKLNEEITLF